MTETAKKSNKKILIGVVALVVLIAIFAVVYAFFGAKTVEGSKNITISVVNKAQETTTYELQTDAEVLREAMEEAQEDGLTFFGTEGDYGLMISTVNGETADYSVDGSYWSFYVNDAYCNYGIESQPVTDGDAFKIVYEVNVIE